MKSARRRWVTAVLLGAALTPAVAGAATITVTSTADTVAVDGAVTLREAVNSINAGANANADVVAVGAYGTNDAINFNIPGAGVHTIQPGSAYVLTKTVAINGYSQPGSSPNTLAVGNDAVLRIELDGTNAGGPNGLIELTAGPSTVRGLVINRVAGSNGAGLKISGGSGSTVAGNFVGTDPTGTITRPNGCNGVRVDGPSSDNVVGGSNPADRNVLSGTVLCGATLVIESSFGNQVENNYVGTNAAGTAALGASFTGVFVSGGSTVNTIGGITAAVRNVISGNTGHGVFFGDGPNDNSVEGNFIGTDASGTSAVPNGTGVRIHANVATTSVGGLSAGAGNRIAFNTGPGVSLRGGPSPALTGNSVRGNSIYSNGGLGIDLGEDGVTANDACDADTGPNDFQNFPVITSATATASSVTVQGTLTSNPNTGPYRIEIFANDACDVSGNGEGKTFLGATTASTDGTCNGTFNVTLPVSVSPTAKLTATATAPNGSTSEFSPCFGIQTVFYTVAPCRVADTRNAPGPSGGPALSANTIRTFPVTGICGIPTSARAVAVNLAVFIPSNDGDLRVYPAGGAVPNASAINFRPGIVRANNAIIPLGTGGQISVQCDMPSGSTNFFFDVYGYFE